MDKNTDKGISKRGLKGLEELAALANAARQRGISKRGLKDEFVEAYGPNLENLANLKKRIERMR